MNKAKSLYIHIPFCDSLCDYCDFTKLLYRDDFASNYLEKLKIELDSYAPKDVETIYIGGGTPTSLSDSLFFALFSMLTPYKNNVKEFTVEVNPESLAEQKISIMKDAGVNRVSIGVESTNNKILKSINRKHTFEDVQKCVKNLRNSGISNINLDLIIGLPNVTETLFKRDLENIVSLQPNHISCYSLTVHEHTVFNTKKVKEPDENFSRKMYDFAHEFLSQKGYNHYEVSNWAKPGFESIHNLTYWNNDRYYAIGLGASGYLDNIRYKNTTNLNYYLKGDYVDEKEIVKRSDLRTYFLMTSLRTTFGLDLKRFKEEIGEDLLVSYEKEINDFIKRKLLEIKGNYLCPTYEGMMVLDSILLSLI